jgi:hypothetical protein
MRPDLLGPSYQTFAPLDNFQSRPQKCLHNIFHSFPNPCWQFDADHGIDRASNQGCLDQGESASAVKQFALPSGGACQSSCPGAIEAHF